ncbi:MAG: exo-alpha-sialidase [Cyclobacteriaceae bacterium]|nr:exo-alpha-sialidase [Cyclobacteriaceae bacterium]
MKSRKCIAVRILVLLCLTWGNQLYGQVKEASEIKRIWDFGTHNAFTDITYFKGKFYTVFREAEGHLPKMDNSGNGKIRILSSVDGEFWESAGLIELPGIDLRDPKVSLTPKKRLMILMGGSKYEKQELQSITSYYAISDPNGNKFSSPEPVLLPAQIKSDFNWLWRVSWYDKTGYGVVYQSNADGEKGKSKAYLVSTDKGEEYELVTELKIDGNPSEATIRFMSGAEMVMLVRRDGGDRKAMLGTSKAPYTDWSWQKLDFEVGGPNLEVIPINKILIGARLQGEDGPYTALLLGKKGEDFREVKRLPSGGDTGYPGFYSIAGYIWLSYYSSHEGKASVYYSRIPYAELK